MQLTGLLQKHQKLKEKILSANRIIRFTAIR